MAEPATRSVRSLGATRETVIRPPVFSPGSLRPAFRGLIEHRDLLYTLSLHRIRVRYKQSLLGIGWAVVQPLATMLVLTVVFAYITRVPTGGVPYAVLALAGLVPWTCFANGLTTATHSLVSHAQLVTKVYFPREILPLTYVIAAVTDAAIAAAALVGLMAWYTVPVAPRIGLVLVTAATLIALVTALALVLSAVQVRMRDVGVAMPIALQLLMFASPVAYSLDTVPARLHALYILNPLVGIIENFRRAALDTGPTDVESLQVSIVWTVVLLPIAYVWFKRVEATAADVV
jgi:lipopolysaccharide transport system permease protein